ncbi:hypothetical protein [Herminiimonas aquatilis]|uniref:Uncharacterized protein n=1 Tax=Herminiimonas aquatilis TaxID=345342 RepID=A0ABW2J963_9BURK
MNGGAGIPWSTFFVDVLPRTFMRAYPDSIAMALAIPTIRKHFYLRSLTVFAGSPALIFKLKKQAQQAFF